MVWDTVLSAMNALAKGLQFKSLWWFLSFPTLISYFAKKKNLSCSVCSSDLLFVCYFQWLSKGFAPSVPFHPARCPTSPRAVPSHPKIKGFENRLITQNVHDVLRYHEMAPLYTPVSIVIVLMIHDLAWQNIFKVTRNLSWHKQICPTSPRSPLVRKKKKGGGGKQVDFIGTGES